MKHNVWGQVYSVSRTLSRENDCQDAASEAKPEGVKVAWLTSPPTHGNQPPRWAGGGRRQALIEQLKFYCDNSSLAGYKYITEIERTWFERIMWICLHVIMVCALGAIIWNVLQDFKNTPVVTIVDSDHFPSNLLDFPGISVCSINRISQKAAMKLAEQLISINVTNLAIDKILLLINDLGNLYESSFKSFRNGSQTDDLLRKYIYDNYQLNELMKELTPKCSDILVKCRFRSSNRNCSTLFSFRKTQDGYCCLFNYVREQDDVHGHGQMAKSHTKRPLKIEKLTLLNSLSFLIDPFLNDYFYSILPLTGWKIMIFSPNDYPDNTSGGVTETLITPGTENFLELNAVSFFTEKAVRRFDIRDRKCIFKDEISALFNAYTYSDCIVDCKVKSMWKMCGCQPFFYPVRDSRRLCTPSDNNCLHEYKTKWWSVMPHDMKEESEESRIFNFISNETWSLRCRNCYPSCEDVRYSLQTSSIALRNDGETSFLKDIAIVNQSLVHIYFSKYGTLRLKQDSAYYWYELLSDIGGLCGVFIGFSLISAIEFIYFLVLSSASLYGASDTPRRPCDRHGDSESRDIRPLYWSELKPRGKSANAKTKTQPLNLPFPS